MIWEGKLLHIHTAEAGGSPMIGHDRIRCLAGVGLEGDRYATGRGYYSPKPDIREVTLIESETLEALRRDHGIDLPADEHRRNLTTLGVPLNHLVGRRFMVGGVMLEGGRLNIPCLYLETLTGKKLFKPLVHRSGLNCRIVAGGLIATGDAIRPC